MMSQKQKSFFKVISEWILLLGIDAGIITTLAKQEERLKVNEKLDAFDHVNIQYRIDCVTYSISNMTLMLSIATNNLDYIRQRLDKIIR